MIEFINTILAIWLFPLVLIQISWLTFYILSSFKSFKSNKKFPKITILIPAHNKEKEIKDTLESIRNLNYPKDKIEIIVIENASTDNTYKVAKSFEKKMKNLKVLKIKEKGKAIALNYGLNFVNTEYTLILDADTILEKNSLKNAIKYLNDNVAGVSFAIKVLNDRNILTKIQKIEYLYNNIIKKGLSILKEGTTYIWGCAILYKTELLKKLKFRQIATEDIDINLRIQCLGYKIVFAEDCIAYTYVPEDLKSFIKQRIRWFSHSLLTFNIYKENIKNIFSNPTLYLYSYPFLLFFWVPFSFFIAPLNLYSILYWLQYQKTLIEIAIYFLNWFSFFGVINGIYNVIIGNWKLNLVMIFGYSSAILTFVLYIISLIKYKEFKAREVFLSLFLFPYYFLLNILYIITTLDFIIKHFRKL